MADDWDSKKFWKEQDFQVSARLHLQHLIWRRQFGWHLHPAIEVSQTENVRIADVACGNGAWILDIAREHPYAQCTALDIASSNFTNANWLPSNVSMTTWDCFSSVPPHFVGVFDVVHVRAIASAIVNDKVEPLLSNLVTMLKPGGYLQWDENVSGTLEAHVAPSPSEEVDNNKRASATKALIAILTAQRLKHGITSGWMRNLPNLLEAEGCAVVAHEQPGSKRELARAWTDNMQVNWLSLVSRMPETPVPMQKEAGLPEGFLLSRRTFAELLERSGEETTGGGVRVDMKQIVVVAKKGRPWADN